jgi:hypothetical protein
MGRATMEYALEAARIHSRCKDDVRPGRFLAYNEARLLLDHGAHVQWNAPNFQDTHLCLLRSNVFSGL